MSGTVFFLYGRTRFPAKIPHRPTLASLSAFQAFVPYMSKVKSPRFLGSLVGLIPMARVRRLKAMVDVMESQSREILTLKKSAVEKMDDGDSVAEGKDIMTILCALNWYHGSCYGLMFSLSES